MKIGICTLALGLLLATPAWAEEVTRKGNSNYTGTVTHTNRKGETHNHSVNGQRTRTDGTVTNSGTVTGANGNQGTYNNTRTCNSGECTFNRNTTYPNGKTRQVNGTATRTDKGSYSGNATVTGRNGNTRSGSFIRTGVR